MYDIYESAVLCHLYMSGCGFLFAPDHIYHFQFPCPVIQTIYIGMVHSQIRRHKIFVIPRHLNAADMRPEIAFCNASQTFMIDLICNFSDSAIII